MNESKIHVREKDIIFLAYSNSSKNSLSYLQKEYQETNDLFDQNPSDTIDVHSKIGVTRDYIIDYLITYREKILVFQFSGHADSDTLILEDDATNPKGIIQLLAKCPKLKLIILNGCATHAQANLILDEENLSSIVISTSAPIKDHSAFKYATNFWKALYQNSENYLTAHEIGIAVANSLKGNIEINSTRNAGFINDSDKTNSQSLWDISCESEMMLEETLPKDLPELAEPNKVLREKLLHSFSKHKEEVKQAKENTALEKEDQETKILEVLPLSISEQIRKLFAQSSQREIDKDYIFYDVYDHHRLQQIIKAYRTLIETITFIHIVQLWEEFDKSKNTEEGVLKAVEYYFDLKKKEKEEYSILPLAFTINQCFTKNGIDNFLEEWNDNLNLILEDNEFLWEAINFMEDTSKHLSSYDVPKIITSCIEGERYLAAIYSKFSFIVNYKMVSIQGIEIKKYRHDPNETYWHNIVRLDSKFKSRSNQVNIKVIKEDSKKTNIPIFNDSVFIESLSGNYLNLTPFIIDENSFNNKAHLAKICHFELSERTPRNKTNYYFSHVYHRDKEEETTGKNQQKNINLLAIKEDEEFTSIKEQLNSFKTFTSNSHK